MFIRRVQVGRAVIMYDNSYYGSSCYTLREWLNIDKLIRRKRVIYNISTPYVKIRGFIGGDPFVF